MRAQSLKSPGKSDKETVPDRNEDKGLFHCEYLEK